MQADHNGLFIQPKTGNPVSAKADMFRPGHSFTPSIISNSLMKKTHVFFIFCFSFVVVYMYIYR
jgi:hypothetical protein